MVVDCRNNLESCSINIFLREQGLRGGELTLKSV